MYNLYNGLQRTLNMINWNGVVSTMSAVLHPNSVSPWAVSQCHPTTSWDEPGNCDGAAGCSALWPGQSCSKNGERGVPKKGGKCDSGLCLPGLLSEKSCSSESEGISGGCMSLGVGQCFGVSCEWEGNQAANALGIRCLANELVKIIFSSEFTWHQPLSRYLQGTWLEEVQVCSSAAVSTLLS